MQINPNGAVGIIITIAGGLSGSLFALLSSPKARNTRSETITVSKKEFEAAPAKKTRNKTVEKKAPKQKPEVDTSSSDETVIGTIKF